MKWSKKSVSHSICVPSYISVRSDAILLVLLCQTCKHRTSPPMPSKPLPFYCVYYVSGMETFTRSSGCSDKTVQYSFCVPSWETVYTVLRARRCGKLEINYRKRTVKHWVLWLHRWRPVDWASVWCPVRLWESAKEVKLLVPVRSHVMAATASWCPAVILGFVNFRNCQNCWERRCHMNDTTEWSMQTVQGTYKSKDKKKSLLKPPKYGQFDKILWSKVLLLERLARLPMHFYLFHQWMELFAVGSVDAWDAVTVSKADLRSWFPMKLPTTELNSSTTV